MLGPEKRRENLPHHRSAAEPLSFSVFVCRKNVNVKSIKAHLNKSERKKILHSTEIGDSVGRFVQGSGPYKAEMFIQIKARTNSNPQ